MRQIKTPEYLWAVWTFGILSGILVPILLVMVGWLIQLLLEGQQAISSGSTKVIPETLSVGALFHLPTVWLNAGGSILRGVFGVLVIVVIVFALECISLLTCYRAAIHVSLDIAVAIQRKLFEKSGALAIEKGLSGQQEAMRDMMFIHVPQVRETISQWCRVFPRHIIQSILLIVLACSIQLSITVLAFICAMVVWSLYNYMDAVRRKRRPVLFERARASSEQLAYLCETAPLLASVHDQEDTKHNFESRLQTYRQTQLLLSDGGIWKSPTILLAGTLLGAFLVVVIAIRFLDSSGSLHFGELAMLCASVGLSVAGSYRFWRAYRRFKSAEQAVSQLTTYLEQPTMTHNQMTRNQSVEKLQQITFDHVTIRDSSSHKLLENISLNIKSGQLTAIVASEPVQASALAELILGFGRPASGRILFDNVDSTDINPIVIRKASLWVAARGPLVDGILEENLWAGISPDATIDLMSYAKRMHVSDAILNLPDGIMTMVSPNEDRVQPDHLFRLGLTRGLIKKPKLVVAQEPAVRVKATTESDTLDAILQLKSKNMLLVVLALRLSTLRAADQIVVLHEHRVAATGTHTELLEKSEIYRHLNYIQFSPFNEQVTS